MYVHEVRENRLYYLTMFLCIVWVCNSNGFSSECDYAPQINGGLLHRSAPISYREENSVTTARRVLGIGAWLLSQYYMTTAPVPLQQMYLTERLTI